MATYQIICGGPGPHQPPTGILGTSDQPTIADHRCSAAACVKAPDPSTVNRSSIEQRARDALTTNAAFLAITSPTNTQVVAQVRALTRQVNGLARLTLGELDQDT